MEEERKIRLERTEVLKHLLTMEVEARATELMETDDGYVESSSEVEMKTIPFPTTWERYSIWTVTKTRRPLPTSRRAPANMERWR